MSPRKHVLSLFSSNIIHSLKTSTSTSPLIFFLHFTIPLSPPLLFFLLFSSLFLSSSFLPHLSLSLLSSPLHSFPFFCSPLISHPFLSPPLSSSLLFYPLSFLLSSLRSFHPLPAPLHGRLVEQASSTTITSPFGSALTYVYLSGVGTCV